MLKEIDDELVGVRLRGADTGLWGPKAVASMLSDFCARSPGPAFLNGMLPALKECIAKLNGWMADMKAGQRLTFIRHPGVGIEVGVYGTVKGTIQGHDLARALLSIWLGDTAESGAQARPAGRRVRIGAHRSRWISFAAPRNRYARF